MPRDIPVGNGSLLICFDKNYYIRDLYFPYVGKENHVMGNVCRFGVWVDGQFAWMSDGWERELRYRDDTMVTDVRLTHPGLGLRLECNDAVDYYENLYLRRINVVNLTDRAREVRIYFHHSFNIAESDVGDTALFDPKLNCILHYKSERYFLINFFNDNHFGVEHYAIGKKGGGLEGTWRDAEDGKLEMHAIAQGSVDSTIGMYLPPLPPRGEDDFYYWIIAGKTYGECAHANAFVREYHADRVLKRINDYWKLSIAKEGFQFNHLPGSIQSLFKRSILVVRSQIDNEGAIIAANDSDITFAGRDTYSYMWPRDGALVASALDHAGYSEITRTFFRFCARVIKQNGYFLHKYNPNGTVASSWHPWVRDGHTQLPIQEDETALVVWALWRHYEKFRDLEFLRPLYGPLVIRTADFMCEFRNEKTGLPHPSYDLWEERHGVLTFTTAAVIAGLRAAARLASAFGDSDKSERYTTVADAMKEGMNKYLFSERHNRFLRMINFRKDGTVEIDETIDASMYAVFAFGVYPPDDPKVVATMEAIRNRLWCKTKVGGIARYENDYYHQVTQDVANVPGNPWFICTMWYAQYQIARAKTVDELQQAIPTLEWVTAHALRSGILAEQVNPFDNQPLSVSPLTWSHATFVTCVMECLEKLEQMDRCETCDQPVFHHKLR
jgi:oligosaccharide amylase